VPPPAGWSDVWKDPNTGLMWARKDNGSAITQRDALNYCQNLNLASFRDWRLPEIDEFQPVYDPSVVSGSTFHGDQRLDLHVKGNLKLTGETEWGATHGNRAGEAWTFSFVYGMKLSLDGGTILNRALCVRRAGE
jgi:Protein of unknown function (DUF1566)